MTMKTGRLSIRRPHRAEHWWQGICFEWMRKRRPADPPWRVRHRFVRIYVQW